MYTERVNRMLRVLAQFLTPLLLISLAGCNPSDKAAENKETAKESVTGAAAQESVPRYSARQFFETTTYGLPSSEGFAFSPDGESILIHSDKDGVFNAYALPVDGGDPRQLTNSE